MNLRKVSVYVFVALLCLWSLFPIYQIFIFSFMREVEVVARPTHWIPQKPTVSNYLGILGVIGGEIVGRPFALIRGLKNSFIIALMTTLVTMAVATTAGYAFGRFRFRFKNGLLFTLLVTRMLPTMAIVIPYSYLFNQLGLVGTHIGLFITYLSFVIPLSTWVLLGYMATLPLETERAARIAGCTRFMALRKVIMPMAAPGIAAIGILAFLSCWNEFLFALILNSGTPAETVSPVIASFFSPVSGKSAPSAMSAAVILGLLPVFVMALIFQKYITKLKIVDPVTIVER